MRKISAKGASNGRRAILKRLFAALRKHAQLKHQCLNVLLCLLLLQQVGQGPYWRFGLQTPETLLNEWSAFSGQPRVRAKEKL